MKDGKGMTLMRTMRTMVAMTIATASTAVMAADHPINAFNWATETTGYAITNAVDFMTSSNWTLGTPTSEQELQLRQSDTVHMPTVNRYIKIGEGGLDTFYRLYAGYSLSPSAELNVTKDTTPRTILVSDHKLTFNQRSVCMAMMVYADVYCVNTSAYFDKTVLCGDFYGDSFCANQAVAHRLDLYANQAGGTRINPGPTGTFYISYGGFGDGYHMYAPYSSKVAQTWTYTATAGSTYLTPASSTTVGLKLPVGTLVTDAGNTLPEGTFLKRIFPDGIIELSNAPTTSGDMSLTFAPMSVKVENTLGSMTSSQGGDQIWLMKHAEEDEMTFILKEMNITVGKTAVFDCEDGFYPGVVRLVTVGGNFFQVKLGTCIVELSDNWVSSKPAGIPDKPVFMAAANDTARLVVTNGVTAGVNVFYNLIGTLEKMGTGTLQLGLNTNVVNNTGKLVLREGVTELAAGSYVKTLAISNGATLRLSGDSSVDNIILDEGARVEGSGLLRVTTKPTTFPQTVTIGDDAALSLVGGSGYIFSPGDNPGMSAVSTQPAFWIDASDTDSMTLEEQYGTNFITRINDVRKTSADDAYMFATNVILKPWIEHDRNYYNTTTDDTTTPHIMLQKISGVTDVSNVYDLVWSTPLKNIRAIFIAQILKEGGGVILGMTDTLKAQLTSGQYEAPFLRDPGAGWTDPIVAVANAYLPILDAPCYHNGAARSARLDYPYAGDILTSSSNYGTYPVVVTDIHPTSDVAADCFGYYWGANSRNGHKRICEVLVFTNQVTETDRMIIEQYLMRKWKNTSAPIVRATNGDAKTIEQLPAATAGLFAPSAGETLLVRGLQGAGTYRKAGEGVTYLDSQTNAAMSLDVQSGTLKVRSQTGDDANLLPEGPAVHFDATRTDLMTFKSGTQNQLDSWKSVNAEGKTGRAQPGSTNRPVLVENFFNGKNVVDFGDPISHWDDKDATLRTEPNDLPVLWYDTTYRKMHTVLMVQDTRKSGGSIVGEYNTWSSDGLMRSMWWKDHSGVLQYNNVPPITYENPIIATSDENSHGSIYKTLKTSGCKDALYRARLNGKAINPQAVGFTGGQDMLTLVLNERFWTSAFSIDTGYASCGGGQILAEYLLYERGLDPLEIADVEAYFRKKWYGVDEPGYEQAKVAGVSVSSGATLEVTGNKPLVTSAIGCAGGTINGDLALTSENAELQVYVAQDGTVSPITLNGTIDLSKGGTLRLTGYPDALQPGSYNVLLNSGITASNAGVWTAANRPKGRKCRLVAHNGVLTLRCWDGFCVIIK